MRGIIHESFGIESNLLRFLALQIESTIQIFWKKFYESNPRYESLRFGFASLPAWIHKDSFHAIVLMIREDLLDSWKQVESLEVQVMIRIFKNQTCESMKSDLSITIRNEPFWSQDSWRRYKTDPCFYESLIRFLHP